MLEERGPERCPQATLLARLEQVLRDMEWDTDLFANLLSSYPDLLRAEIGSKRRTYTNF